VPEAELLTLVAVAVEVAEYSDCPEVLEELEEAV
jgi:hypothetical protein